MKKACVVGLAAVLSISIAAHATRYTAPGPEDAQKQPAAAVLPDGTLSDAQIAALKTKVSDKGAERGVIYLKARFVPAGVSKADAAKYAKSGKIPVRIACYFLPAKNAPKTSSDVHLYVKDSDGNLVTRPTTVPLDSMKMVMNDAMGGYFGEMPKAGTYTAVVWVDLKEKGMFGRAIALTLSADSVHINKTVEALELATGYEKTKNLNWGKPEQVEPRLGEDYVKQEQWVFFETPEEEEELLWKRVLAVKADGTVYNLRDIDGKQDDFSPKKARQLAEQYAKDHNKDYGKPEQVLRRNRDTYVVKSSGKKDLIVERAGTVVEEQWVLRCGTRSPSPEEMELIHMEEEEWLKDHPQERVDPR